MSRYIDADALKKHYAWWEDDKQKLFDSIVGQQPTVDAVPVRHGKWLDTEFIKLRECSCCHVRWGMYDTENFKYCPNCGARMRDE